MDRNNIMDGDIDSWIPPLGIQIDINFEQAHIEELRKNRTKACSQMDQLFNISKKEEKKSRKDHCNAPEKTTPKKGRNGIAFRLKNSRREAWIFRTRKALDFGRAC